MEARALTADQGIDVLLPLLRTGEDDARRGSLGPGENGGVQAHAVPVNVLLHLQHVGAPEPPATDLFGEVEAVDSRLPGGPHDLPPRLGDLRVAPPLLVQVESAVLEAVGQPLLQRPYRLLVQAVDFLVDCVQVIRSVV